jgi:hypothetical protein
MADPYDWQALLTTWSAELLDAPHDFARIPADVRSRGWLGHDGATPQQLDDAESRLQVKLPRSYREFLAFTNGWHTTGPFIERLWSTREVDWFRVRHRAWIAAYTSWLPRIGPSVSDEEYFVYGTAQDCALFRSEYLRTALEISDVGDSAIYLLNPETIAADGEWEAWMFANWLPGSTRHRSFWELMNAEYASFQNLLADQA